MDRRFSAASISRRRSDTVPPTAETSTNAAFVVSATTCASEVLPVPAGPNRITELSLSCSMALRSQLPGPTASCWPTSSSSERGRMRTAKGATFDFASFSISVNNVSIVRMVPFPALPCAQMFPFRSEFHKSAYVCRNKLQSRRLLLDTADSNTRQHETERPGAFFVRHMPSASCAPFPTLRAFCILRASASCTPSAFCTLSAFCTPLDFPYFTSQRNTGSGAAKCNFFRICESKGAAILVLGSVGK